MNPGPACRPPSGPCPPPRAGVLGALSILQICCALLAPGAVAQDETAGQAHPGWSRAQLDALGPFLDSVMAEARVPGLSFAVFSSRGILFEYTGGVANADTGRPVDRTTVFEAASITKPLFAWALAGLVAEGALDLDRPVTALVTPVPEVGYDPRSARLTPRLLLSHQGGLPNWRARLDVGARSREELFPGGDTLRFEADPGSGYRYSGEGFVLLQRAVEQGLGLALPELLQTRVFRPLGMARSAAAFDPSAMAATAFGHAPDGMPDKWQLSVPLASSTLHTTASDLARFGVAVARELRQGGSQAVLFEPQVLVAEDGPSRLEWGLGFGLLTMGDRRYVYHGGNNVIFIADFIYGAAEDLGYALLTNSANGRQVVEALERRIFGLEMPR